MSIRNELLEEILAATQSGPGELNGRVRVTQASDFGVIDSNKEYFLDGIIDFTGTGLSIEIPSGGIYITGYNFDTSGLKCTDAAYTLFTSPVGGSGNILFKDFLIDIQGAGSQVYDITGDTGFEAIEVSRINFNNCASLGTVDTYRQGLETGTGRFGGTPELTLAGTWVGGYFIDTSIVRSLSNAAFTLYKAGTAFVMNSRFRSNQNIDLPALASFVDFAPANFTNPSTLQLEQCIITRNGVADAGDANLTPNISASDLESSWTSNNGLPNTFEGGRTNVTVEATTTIVQNVFTDLLGTWTASGLQHFDSPSNGQLRHLGNSPREYKVLTSIVLEGNQNDIVTIKIVKFDSSATSFTDVETQTRTINQLQGARNVGFFSLFAVVTLDQNDYVKVQVTDTSGSNDVTAEIDAFLIVDER
ncbi:MAG: hypothetical protein JKY50_00445 [Oleispira sp.]|nr:hypothetical protein [Oleispira sp.]